MKDTVNYRVWHCELKIYGQQFIKHIVAEDGTEFKAVAFSFSGFVVTLAHVLESDMFVLEQYVGYDDSNGNMLFANTWILFTRFNLRCDGSLLGKTLKHVCHIYWSDKYKAFRYDMFNKERCFSSGSLPMNDDRAEANKTEIIKKPTGKQFE